MPSPRSFPGWCPIDPRGFVSLNDVVPIMPSDSGAAAADDGLALQKSDVQRELECLEQARSEVAAELHRLQEQRAVEREKLEHCRQQRGRMEQKLRRCSDVVAFTVNAMDRLHGHGEEEEEEFSDGEEPDNVAHEMHANLLVAGLAARQSLCSIAEERDGTEGDTCSFSEAAASCGHHVDASDDSSVEMESDGEAANKENTPPACAKACLDTAVMSAGKEGVGDGDVYSLQLHLGSPPYVFPAGIPQPREPLRRIDQMQQ